MRKSKISKSAKIAVKWREQLWREGEKKRKEERRVKGKEIREKTAGAPPWWSRSRPQHRAASAAPPSPRQGQTNKRKPRVGGHIFSITEQSKLCCFNYLSK